MKLRNRPPAPCYDPHLVMPVRTHGEPPATAAAAAVLLHGRGATAESMIALAAEALTLPGLAFVAPQAADQTWYPYTFLSPLARNEPKLSSAFNVLTDVREQLEEAGVPRARIVLVGFSQGACLALEYAARNAARWGGVVGWSGGLIGPEGAPRDYPGALAGTPVLLGCSDRDPHIPLARVHETAEALRGLGAHVEERIYPGMGHTVNDDELEQARALLAAVVAEGVR